MNDSSGGVFVTAMAGLVVVVCCGGPLLVAAALSVGMGAWLATHGLWLLGGLVLLPASAALIVGLRIRRVAPPDPAKRAQCDQVVSRQPAVGGRPSGRRRAPRRRRWRSAHFVGYSAVVVLLGLAFFLVARSGMRSPASTPIAQTGGAIVAYEGDDQLGGHESSIGRVLGQGRPLVLNYFAGACAPCTAEMPGFEKAYESSAGKVLIVGLDVGPFTGMGSHQDAARLLRQLAIRYLAAYAVDDSALRNYGIDAMPTTLFFDATGCLVGRSNGALTQPDLEARIQNLEVAAPS